MNLIEQLGGYENAKYALALECKLPSPNTRYIIELQDCLLQYRRENNIFEVGDAIIYDEFNSIGSFSKHVGKTKTLCYINYGLGELTALIKYLRHATPEEIKAGRRL